MQNEYGQGKSHASGDSVVPDKVQEQAPKGVEDKLPNAVHDTGNSDSTTKSHATGDSIVPESVQKVVPQGVEEALPNAIHDTSKK